MVLLCSSDYYETSNSSRSVEDESAQSMGKNIKQVTRSCIHKGLISHELGELLLIYSQLRRTPPTGLALCANVCYRVETLQLTNFKEVLC